MIKVKWSDKITNKYNIIFLDKYDIKHLSKKTGISKPDVVNELELGKVIETDNHTYEKVD